jgi:hypothetical protein
VLIKSIQSKEIELKSPAIFSKIRQANKFFVELHRKGFNYFEAKIKTKSGGIYSKIRVYQASRKKVTKSPTSSPQLHFTIQRILKRQ